MKLPFDTEILLRYVRNVSDSSEREMVTRWLEEDEENREFLKRFESFWNALGTEKSARTVDVDGAWAEVSGKLNGAKQRNLFPWRWAVAACVALVAGFGAYQYWERTSWTEYVATDMQKEIVLPDQSRVSLNYHSKIAYRGSDDKREVRVEGEAYFEVQRDTEKPFRITANEAKVEVLGTKFNVTAYSGDSLINVQVTEGLVGFAPEKGLYAKLPKGQEAVFNRNSNNLAVNESMDPNALSWMSKKLVFEDTPLPEVLRSVSLTYGIRLSADPSLYKRTLNARFDNKPKEEVLSVIAALLGANLEESPEGYRYVK
ncbi:anti-sigma factor (plasmid) [Fulvitalea axinellae]|uniref:Anti-sigma factor n=1 Tax=Fulvitalea axinellae TaxID=1182444 RepID=A0AAU9DKP4_9BACT|nr:anti-sigma factor [Fulvitalea axinellae]